jgi:hypothetical protein
VLPASARVWAEQPVHDQIRAFARGARLALPGDRLSPAAPMCDGPSGFRQLSGPPTEQKPYSRPRSADQARRGRSIREELAGSRFPAVCSGAPA